MREERGKASERQSERYRQVVYVCYIKGRPEHKFGPFTIDTQLSACICRSFEQSIPTRPVYA